MKNLNSGPGPNMLKCLEILKQSMKDDHTNDDNNINKHVENIHETCITFIPLSFHLLHNLACFLHLSAYLLHGRDTP